MNRKDFLNNPQVTQFVGWMKAKLDSEEQLHGWKSRSHASGVRRGMTQVFRSLKDAHEKFYWPSRNSSGAVISDFQGTKGHLSDLGRQLKSAIDANDPEKSQEACKQILTWGGVWRYQNVASSLRPTANDELEQLPSRLANIREMLNVGSTSESFQVNLTQRGLQVDSGTTKIYSLLCPSWVIYDGRVGSALGMLVSKWAKETNRELSEVPNQLKFAHARESHRNPNQTGETVFPVIVNNDSRIMHNLHANWLLAEALCSPDKSLPEDFGIRELESALFMLGYSMQ